MRRASVETISISCQCETHVSHSPSLAPAPTVPRRWATGCSRRALPFNRQPITFCRCAAHQTLRTKPYRPVLYTLLFESKGVWSLAAPNLLKLATSRLQICADPGHLRIKSHSRTRPIASEHLPARETRCTHIFRVCSKICTFCPEKPPYALCAAPRSRHSTPTLPGRRYAAFCCVFLSGRKNLFVEAMSHFC